MNHESTPPEIPTASEAIEAARAELQQALADNAFGKNEIEKLDAASIVYYRELLKVVTNPDAAYHAYTGAIYKLELQFKRASVETTGTRPSTKVINLGPGKGPAIPKKEVDARPQLGGGVRIHRAA